MSEMTFNYPLVPFSGSAMTITTSTGVLQPFASCLVVSETSGMVMTDEEREVLRVVLDRDRTAAIVHGGLKGLLSLSHDQAETLLQLLRRV